MQRAELAPWCSAAARPPRDRAAAPTSRATRCRPSARTPRSRSRSTPTPRIPGLLANTSDVTGEAIVARLLALLDDPEPGPRASAVKALVAVRPSAAVVAALDAHVPGRRPENDFGDYRLAESVARLVHAGTGTADVVALLDDRDLFRRRFVWELLHVALRLDPRSFDPSVDPTAAGRKAPDAAAIAAALARRRGAGERGARHAPRHRAPARRAHRARSRRPRGRRRGRCWCCSARAAPGKSTLLRLVAGLDAPNEGTIEIGAASSRTRRAGSRRTRAASGWSSRPSSCGRT